MKRSYSAALVLTLVAGAIFASHPEPTVAGDSAAAKEFKKAFNDTQNSWERRAAVLRLDPKDEDSLDLLTEFVLKQQDWYMREAAIEAIATAYDAAVIAKLEKLAGGRADPTIIEGILMAFGKAGNTERVPFMITQLENKKWQVQRAAAVALAQVPDKRSVEALIACWEGPAKDNFMVWVHILESLEHITQEKDKPKARDWRGWWNAVKDNWEVPKPKEGAEADEEAGKSGERLQTRVRGTNLDIRSRGKGLPLLVLPDYGYDKNYLETYFRNLEETSQILYVKLPGTADFEPALANAPGLPMPFYPIDRIVESFEGLHAELVKTNKIQDKPFAIMAHGLTCWIAMAYAAKHPGRVRKMILIGPASGDKARSDGRERVERGGQERRDLELEHYGQSLLYDQQAGKSKYEPSGNDDGAALTRKSLTCRFFDYRDLEIGRIHGPIVEKDGARGPAFLRNVGGCFIPEFSLFKLDKVATQALVIAGENSLWTSPDDINAIVSHYGSGARPMIFKKSSDMPFIEENEKFVEAVQRFLGVQKKKDDKEK